VKRFNSSLEGNTKRAIDIHESKETDSVEFKVSSRRCAIVLMSPESVKEADCLLNGPPLEVDNRLTFALYPIVPLAPLVL
jgi:hypothetical protein